MKRFTAAAALVVAVAAACGDPAKPVSNVVALPQPDTGFPTDLPHARPPMLRFREQPRGAVAGEIISPAIVVEVLDTAGRFDPTSNIEIFVYLKPYKGGVLRGDTIVRANHGVAVFDHLIITEPAPTWSLIAAAPGRAWVRTWMFPVVE